MQTPIEITAPGPGHSGQVAESKFEGNDSLKRRHDLDALRAVAMLLGIVLHTALSFAPIPWAVKDAQQSETWGVLFAAIHGFRMPIFFLVSGFFTAMLWRKRELGGLIKQRVKRIVLPLAIGCLTIVPAMWAVSILASQSPNGSDEVRFFDAAASGDTDVLKSAIESQTIAIDALHPASGASLLGVATFYGQTDTVEMLLEHGADVNQKNSDGSTPLHIAIFMGRVESVQLLLQAGAYRDAKDGNGNTPNDNLKVDFGTTYFIAQTYGQTLDEVELKRGRAKIATLLGEDPANATAAVSKGPGPEALYGLLFQLPVFMHLWFLAFLCWLVVGFMGYALIAKFVKFEKFPKWLICSPIGLLWLVPITMLPQYFMMPGFFGPDASVGLLPIPSVLAYYAIFFFFGVIYWELDDRDGMLGNWWYITLPVGLFIVFPIGLEMVAGTFGFLTQESLESMSPLPGNFFQALFAWLMVFGSIGMFRALFSGESNTMRYISDSSYWLYLSHLPLVILAQWFVKEMPVPATVKFIGIVVVISAFLLFIYEYVVRYSIIGSMLNGPKKRTESARPA